MPKVPTYDEPRVGARPINPPTARSEGGSGIEALGKGLQQFGETGFKIAQDARSTADDFRVDKELLKVGDLLGEESWGENGFLHKKGDNAIGYDEHIERVRKQVEKLNEGLAHDGQRRKFTSRATAMVQDAEKGWKRHSGQQTFIAFGDQADAATRQALDQARFADDFESLDAILDRAITSTEVAEDGTRKTGPGPLVRFLNLKGLPPEKIEQLVKDYKNQGYTTAIEHALERNDDGYVDVEHAENLFKAAEPSLNKDQAKKYRSAITEIKFDQKAEDDVRDIIEASRKGENGWADITEVTEKINAKSGPMKKAMKAKWESLKRDEKAAQDVVKSTYYKGVFTDYLKRRRQGDVNAGNFDWIRRNDPDAYQKLQMMFRADAEYWRRLQDWKDGKEREKKAPKIESTPEQLRNYARMKADFMQNPERYADMSVDELNQMWGWALAPDQYKTLMTTDWPSLQKAIRSADNITPQELKETIGSYSRANNLDEDDDEAFSGAVYDGMVRWRKNHKFAPTNEELEKHILTPAFTSVYKNRSRFWLFRREEKAFKWDKDWGEPDGYMDPDTGYEVDAPPPLPGVTDRELEVPEMAERPSEAERAKWLMKNTKMTDEEISSQLAKEGY